jgi:hypothetical protein
MIRWQLLTFVAPTGIAAIRRTPIETFAPIIADSRAVCKQKRHNFYKM